MQSISEYMVLLVILSGSMFACPGRDDPGGYTNKEKGFKIEFPAGWEVKEGEMGLDVIALSPLEGPSDQFRENVSVASSPMNAPLDADAILDSNIPAMIKLITEFKPGERNYFEIGGVKAARLDYTQRQGLARLYVVLYAVPGKARAYLLYCTSEVPAAPRFRERFEKIVSSFKAEK